MGTASWRTGPCQAPRTEDTAGPESKYKAASSLDNLTWPPTVDTLIFVVVLPAGCALHVPLDDVDLLLEPEPTSVLHVSLGDHILMLVPEALLGSGVTGPVPRPVGTGPGTGRFPEPSRGVHGPGAGFLVRSCPRDLLPRRGQRGGRGC